MTLPRIDSSASKADLLFLHGWGGDANSHWSDLRERLSDYCSTAAYDLPGFGESEDLLLEGEEWTVDEGCATLHAVIDVLGGGPLVVVGSSLGGIIALRAASLGGTRISGVVAIGAGPRFINCDDYQYGFDEHAAAEIVAVLRSRFAAFKDAARALHFNDHDRHVAEQCAVRIDSVVDAVRDPEKPIRVHIALTQNDLRDSLPNIRVPVLLIYGECDQVFGPPVHRLMAESIPRATLVEIPGAGHLPHMTRPGDVAAEILRFIQHLRLDDDHRRNPLRRGDSS